MKKILALLTALIMLFTFASCKSNEGEQETTAKAVESQSDAPVDETTAQPDLTDADSTQATSADETTSENETKAFSANPAEWTDEEIIEFYKQAAIKSQTKVTSKQEMTMTEMVVNDGSGFIGKLVEMATPIMKSALKKNSTEFEGITGGYENLELSDAKSVKAYKSGNYTVVEMTLKEQTDGAHGDAYSGSVGHAITVVGDISTVAAELPQFNIDFDNAELKLHYSNPKLKVKINKDGIIEKGTWTYRVDVKLENLYVAAVRIPLSATINSAYGSVDYIITTGGGF